jgi:hypothetical protein
MPLAATWLDRAPLRRSDRLPLDFPHDKHLTVRCVECHHNYLDGTGMELCVLCHRNPARKDLLLGIEPRFHRFCRDCHLEKMAAGKAHGPVRSCRACHFEGNAR